MNLTLIAGGLFLLVGLTIWVLVWLDGIRTALRAAAKIAEYEVHSVKLAIDPLADMLEETASFIPGGIFGATPVRDHWGPRDTRSSRSRDLAEPVGALYVVGNFGVTKIMVRANGVEVTRDGETMGYPLAKVIGWDRGEAP